MSHLKNKHKMKAGYFCFAEALQADSITLGKLHYTQEAYLRWEKCTPTHFPSGEKTDP